MTEDVQMAAELIGRLHQYNNACMNTLSCTCTNTHIHKREHSIALSVASIPSLISPVVLVD